DHRRHPGCAHADLQRKSRGEGCRETGMIARTGALRLGSAAMDDIAFLGAAGTVTGSRYLVTSRDGARGGAGDERVLVDCGMFQGSKQLRERNWEPIPFDAAAIPF